MDPLKKVQQKELIQVDPSELRFPFLPNEMLSASLSIKLVNVTDNYVVFVPRSRKTNVAEYKTRPNGGILPPRSTQEFVVRREAKKSVAQRIECDDKYLLYSTTVTESFNRSEYSSDLDKFYDKHGGQIWHRKDLGVVLCPTYQQKSPDGMPHTKLSTSVPKKLIQVDPNELRFPFLPNEMLSASFSIKLVNVTDEYVVFVPRTLKNNVAEYTTCPDGVILAPRSTQEFIVTRVVKRSVAQSIECQDKYVLFSTTVSESFSSSKYGSDLDKFYDEQGDQIWHRIDLGVMYTHPLSFSILWFGSCRVHTTRDCMTQYDLCVNIDTY